ncbi:MAG TPA: FAD-binding oxidoreductase [Acidimicrobiales bacterium]|nr:FAD-binding oxidoreductase [Acidimicrobiales bacterium]
MDVIVVGGGIAGVSAAYELAARADVVLLEREEQLAHHTTGRSAAAYLETYGSQTVRRLTIASRDFFTDPPAELESPALLSPRPLLWIGPESRRPALEAMATAGQALVPSVQLIDAEYARALCPVLRPEHAAAAMLEPDAMDIDVAALHQAYVRGARQRGGEILRSSPVNGLRRDRDGWTVDTPSTSVRGDVVVNAAGAWADELAIMAGVAPIGLQPLRRTAFICGAPDGVDVRDWPLVADVDDRFYFKPEGPQLLCSLADETPSPPCDAQPDEVDVALAIERINDATTLELRHVRRAWAGLRSFVADRTPVVGMDPDVRGFCWLAGQGGYGIQTAPGMARATAGLVLDGRLPDDLLAMGVDEADLSPVRCR